MCFHYGKAAHINVWSNTLPADVFAELDPHCSVRVRRINIETIIMKKLDFVPLPTRKRFLKMFTKLKTNRDTLVNQSDLIRILVLYLYGGVYLDFDVILVRGTRSINAAELPTPHTSLD